MKIIFNRRFCTYMSVLCFTVITGCNSTSTSTDTTDDTTDDTTSTATNNVVLGSTTSSTSTIGVGCDYNYSAFNSSVTVAGLDSNANWVCSDAERTVTGNGVPDHEVGTFPNGGNPNEIAEAEVDISYTVTPTLAGMATELGGPSGAQGYVLNGVKIDASTAGSCADNATSTDVSGQDSACSLIDNTNGWNIEAVGHSSFDFGTDDNNAHVQPGGAYHYHGMPEGFITSRGGDASNVTMVGWAADGFPIYARYGYSDADDASSKITAMTGSYQLISTDDVLGTRPSTDVIPLGVFQQDWEYVVGSGDLDACNGRTGVTPEFPSGIYHYYATDSYPYFQRCVNGTVEAAGGAGGPPPG